MRIEKVAILSEVVARVKDSDYCFIVNHGGVTVAQMAKLRADLRKLESRLLVVKNTYLAKVAKETGWSDDVNAMLSGNTAIVTGHGEPTAVAKAIMEFVKASAGKASVKGADYDNKIVDAAMVEAYFFSPKSASSVLSTVTLCSAIGSDLLFHSILIRDREAGTADLYRYGEQRRRMRRRLGLRPDGSRC